MHHLCCDRQLRVMVASNSSCQLACRSSGHSPGKEERGQALAETHGGCRKALRRAEAVPSCCCCPRLAARFVLALSSPALRSSSWRRLRALPAGLIPLLCRWVSTEHVAHGRPPTCCHLPQSGGGGCKEAEFKPLYVGTNSNDQAAGWCRSTLRSPICHLSNCLSSDFRLEKDGVKGWFQIWYLEELVEH